MDINDNIGKLVITFSSVEKPGPDLVGICVKETEEMIFLKDALMIDYEDVLNERPNKKLGRLMPYHIPLGMTDVARVDAAVTSVSRDRIQYCVYLPAHGDDRIHQEYYGFFKESASIRQ